MTTLRKCKNNEEAENVVIIDMDSDSSNNVNIQIPEDIAQKPRRSNRLKSVKNIPFKAYIYIDDDDDDDDVDESTANHQGGTGHSPVKLSKGKRMYPGFSMQSDDDHDCEFMVDSSGILQKQWEQASLKKKTTAKIGHDFDFMVDTYVNLHASDIDCAPVQSIIVSEKEKLSETDKRARDEELRAQKVQAEEARLLKRKEAENMRLLDIERRQKQRIEDIRESQKKDEEDMNLKEIYRVHVKHDLKKLEMTCYDMTSLLQGLGILADNDTYVPAHHVRAAYKRALLRFHPDRAQGSDMRQQVEAEEKFKLISRMKDKVMMIN